MRIPFIRRQILFYPVRDVFLNENLLWPSLQRLRQRNDWKIQSIEDLCHICQLRHEYFRFASSWWLFFTLGNQPSLKQNKITTQTFGQCCSSVETGCCSVSIFHGTVDSLLRTSSLMTSWTIVFFCTPVSSTDRFWWRKQRFNTPERGFDVMCLLVTTHSSRLKAVGISRMTKIASSNTQTGKPPT